MGSDSGKLGLVLESREPAEILGSSTVAVCTGCDEYLSTPPYSPGEAYPEYPFGSKALCKGLNPAYEGVRDALRLLGMDAQHYGQSGWNPLGRVARPGDAVVLKPNLVRDFRETRLGDGQCLVTHGSVIRAVLDYVYIALRGQGRIIIADAPHSDADFGVVGRITGLDEIKEFYRRQTGFEVEVYDLRQEMARKVDGVIVGHAPLPGDPAGYAKVNLGLESALAEIGHLCHLLYGAEYDTCEVREHHYDDVHEYLVSKTILSADCVISLPKLKTHAKTGVTLTMKNLVGINGNKNWLPHFRLGTPARSGDQFADDHVTHRIEQKVVTCFKRCFPLLGPLRGLAARPVKRLGKRIFGDTNRDTIRSGSWYGNETTWRMVVDLNRILLYADAEGMLHDEPTRQVFSVVDGIVGGEGNGPLDPTPRPAGTVVAGLNPVAVDLTCARLMGFDYRRLPLLRRALEDHPRPLTAFRYDQLLCESNDPDLAGPLSGLLGPCLAFAPHFGWQGHVEIRA